VGLWVCDTVRGMWERLLEEYGLVEVENQVEESDEDRI
jgi:hypothetical protein